MAEQWTEGLKNALTTFYKSPKNKGKKCDQITLMGLGTLRTISIKCNVCEGRDLYFVTVLVLAFGIANS